MPQLSRRSALLRSAVSGLTLSGLSGWMALAGERRANADPDKLQPPTTPAASATEPALYEFKLGNWDAYIVHDGGFFNPGVQPTIAPEAKADDVTALLKANFLPTDRILLSLNVLVLKREKEVVLIDTGGGNVFGPTVGRLLIGLGRLGITPENVTSVFLTHAHGDHIAGLLTADKKPTFPKATVYIAKPEADFWLGEKAPDLSKGKIPPEMQTSMVEAARMFLGGVKAMLKPVVPGETPVPGISFVPVPGHTPGHAAVRITSGDQSLLHIGDAVHQYALQFPHPEWSIIFDADPALAIASRKSLFTTAAKDRTLIVAYHLPFPGIGYVRTAGSGFEWVPRPWGI